MLKRIPPAVSALLIQTITAAAVGFFALCQSALLLSLFEWGVLQGLLAGLASYCLRMPLWWIPIHLFFVPLMIITLALDISPTWFLVLFLSLLLIYGKTFKTQVPLYLSSRSVHQVLAAVLPEQRPFAFADLGSGCGGLLRHLANVHKNGTFYGIESAPLPFLISKIRSLPGSGCKIFWGDFWKQDFSSYDVVYAYLSPVPMGELWQKAKKEMRPGSLLISNTFIIPGVTPDRIIPVDDFSNSTLYLWKM